MNSNSGFNHLNAGADLGLDMNETMVERSRRKFNTKGVEAKSRVDYLPEANKTGLFITDHISVTDILRPQEIVRTKIMQSPFQDDLTLRLNERLRRPAFKDQTSQKHSFSQQNSSHDRNSHHVGMNLDQTNKYFARYDRKMLCFHYNQDEQSLRQVCQVLDPDPISVYFDEIPKKKAKNPTQEFNYLNLTLQPPNPTFANCLFPRISSKDKDGKSQDENNVVEGNGRTHSLPHEKYGPYTCPKCRGVFVTSQLFAAHMASHYKLEGEIGSSRRDKSPNVHLLHTKEGLRVLPRSFKPSEAKTKWRRSTLWIWDEERSTEENKGVI